MSVKTLNSVQSFTASTSRPQAPTYSVEPAPVSLAAEEKSFHPDGVEAFLEAENPLGCIRGVMWVMAFNAAFFLVGFMIWQSCKSLW